MRIGIVRSAATSSRHREQPVARRLGALVPAVAWVTSSLIATAAFGQAVVPAGGTMVAGASSSVPSPDPGSPIQSSLDHTYSSGTITVIEAPISNSSTHEGAAGSYAGPTEGEGSGSISWDLGTMQASAGLSVNTDASEGPATANGYAKVMLGFRNQTSAPVVATLDLGAWARHSGENYLTSSTDVPTSGVAQGSVVVRGPGVIHQAIATSPVAATGIDVTDDPSNKVVILLPNQTYYVKVDVNASNAGPFGETNSYDSAHATGVSWDIDIGGTPNITILPDTFGGGGSTNWGSLPWEEGGSPSSPPNAACKYVYLAPQASPSTLNLNTNVTLGHLAIDGTSAYTISGANTLTMQCSDGTSITTLDGSHTISAPLAIANDINLGAYNGSSLTASGTVSFSSGVSATKTGDGNVSLSRFTANNLTVNEGKLKSTAAAGAASVVSSLTLQNATDTSDSGVLDITTKGAGFIVDRSSGTAATDMITLGTAGNIVDSLANAFNAPTVWGGAADDDLASITSAAIVNDFQRRIGYATTAQLGITTTGTVLGQTVDNSAVVMRVVLGGDTDIDGDVDFDDLLRMAQNYNDPVPTGGFKWFGGDSDYDGDVDFDDDLILAQNYGDPLLQEQIRQLERVAGAEFLADWHLARAQTPEPATLSLLGLTALGLVRRRT